jgi:hypothetical protein
LKIGIKYCGGCNPAFDRAAAAQKIKDRMKETVEFVSYDDPGAELVLVITGCSAACAGLEGLDMGKVRFINSESEAESFMIK